MKLLKPSFLVLVFGLLVTGCGNLTTREFSLIDQPVNFNTSSTFRIPDAVTSTTIDIETVAPREGRVIEYQPPSLPLTPKSITVQGNGLFNLSYTCINSLTGSLRIIPILVAADNFPQFPTEDFAMSNRLGDPMDLDVASVVQQGYHIDWDTQLTDEQKALVLSGKFMVAVYAKGSITATFSDNNNRACLDANHNYVVTFNMGLNIDSLKTIVQLF